MIRGLPSTTSLSKGGREASSMDIVKIVERNAKSVQLEELWSNTEPKTQNLARIV
jgi:hypothetical protein